MKLENKPFVSRETIYKIICSDKENKGNLWKHCRHKLKYRNRVSGSKISIKTVPSLTLERRLLMKKTRFGDREIDAIVGAENRSAIVTMVERKSAFMMMEKLEHGKNAVELRKVAVRLLTAYIYHVHIFIGGTKFADHENIAKYLKNKFFFTHPYAFWGKG